METSGEPMTGFGSSQGYVRFRSTISVGCMLSDFAGGEYWPPLLRRYTNIRYAFIPVVLVLDVYCTATTSSP